MRINKICRDPPIFTTRGEQLLDARISSLVVVAFFLQVFYLADCDSYAHRSFGGQILCIQSSIGPIALSLRENDISTPKSPIDCRRVLMIVFCTFVYEIMFQKIPEVLVYYVSSIYIYISIFYAIEFDTFQPAHMQKCRHIHICIYIYI